MSADARNSTADDSAAPVPSAGLASLGRGRHVSRHARSGGFVSSPVVRRGVPWRVLAVIAVLGALLSHVVLAWTATAPSFPYDEVTLLQFSKYLSGTGMSYPVTGGGYFPAWSFVIAPLWWVTSDPAVFYHLAIALGVMMAMATIIPLSLFLRRTGVTSDQAVVAASVVMCMPSRSVQAAYALSEKMLFLMLVCLALAAVRLWERPGWGRLAVFAVFILLVVTSHSRAIIVLPASALWLLCMTGRSRRIALGGAVPVVLLGYGGYRFSLWFNGMLLQSDFNQGTGILGNLATRPGIIARVILGQMWYQVVASLGVVLVGVVALVILVIRELTSTKSLGLAGWLLLVTGAFFATAVLAWSGNDVLTLPGRGRLDFIIYGRYADPAFAMVIGVGVCALIRGLRRWAIPCVLGIAVVVTGLMTYWVAPRVATWGVITPAHVAGILPWSSLLPFPQSSAPGWSTDAGYYHTWSWLLPTLWNENRFWLVASLCALAVLVVVLLLRGRPRIMACLLVIVFCVCSVLSYPAVEAFQEKDGGEPEVVSLIQSIEKRHGTVEVSFDRQCYADPGNSLWAENMLTFWLQDGDYRFITSYENLGSGLVLGCPDFAEKSGSGALRVGTASSIGFELWVLPGSLQKQLQSDGLVSSESQ